MAARRYKISLRVMKNISLVSCAHQDGLLRSLVKYFFNTSHSNGDIFTYEDIRFSRESSPGISLVFM